VAAAEGVDLEQTRVASSAHCTKSPSVICKGKLFIYIKNNRGLRALPCGIPPFISLHSEN